MNVKPMELIGNVRQNWLNFVKEFQTLIGTSEYANKRDEFKMQFLLDLIGDEAYEIYKTFEGSMRDVKSGDILNSVIKKFDEHFKSFQSVEDYNCCIFMDRMQKPNESFEEYLNKIKEIATFCKFGPIKNKMLKIRITSGVNDSVLKENLLKLEDSSFDNIIKYCKIYEQAKSAMNHVIKREDIFLDEIKPTGLAVETLADFETNEGRQQSEHPVEDEDSPNASSSSILKNTKIRKYFGNQCGRSYFQPDLLKHHKIIDHGKKRKLGKLFWCEICGNGFTRNDNLKVHAKRVHGNGKSFKCECGKSFAWKKDLMHHKARDFCIIF